MTRPFEDKNNPLNGFKYHTGKKCIESGCDNPAGTAWSPHWCFEHNAERMRRVGGQLESIVKGFGNETK